MASQLQDVFCFSDFIDDWMYHSVSPLQLSNALMKTFLLNRGHFTYTSKDGIIFDVKGSEQQEHDMRRRYFTLMDEQITRDTRFGLLMVSPFRQTENEHHPIWSSCHSLTIYSGSPTQSAKQLLKAINKFRYSTDWSYWKLRREAGRLVVNLGVPIRMMVFEVDNYWKGTEQLSDIGTLKKRWLLDVARSLETHYLGSSPFSLRLYMLTNYSMQLIGADLIASCRPLIRPTYYTDNLSDASSISDSSEYDEVQETRSNFPETQSSFT